METISGIELRDADHLAVLNRSMWFGEAFRGDRCAGAAMTRLRSIGFEINRRYEIISLFPVSVTTSIAFQLGPVVTNAVLLGGCLAAYLGGRWLNKAAEQWARDEFQEVGIDFDAWGN